MAKPRPLEAYFADNPQLTKVLQDIYDELTKDTIYDDTDVVANIDNLESDKLQTAAYTEKWQVITPAADNAWTNVSLAAYGVAVGDVCEIVMVNDADANTIGCRTDGSGLNRYTPTNGWVAVTMHVVAGAASVIELFEQDDSDTTSYLAGYWRFSTT